MNKAKFWFISSLIISLMLIVFGAYLILIVGNPINGLVHIGLSIIVGIDSWLNYLKRKNEETSFSAYVTCFSIFSKY